MIQKCIICKSKKIYHYKSVFKNRYSEEFSKILKISIQELEKNYSNLICYNCNFIFKKKWFSKKILKKIYSDIVRTHPRGWDLISNKFKKNFLFKQFNILEKNIKNNKNEIKLNYIKRTIIGILSSMELDIKNEKLKTELNDSIKKNNLKKINFLKNKIHFNFNPKDYSRYGGFKSIDLFNYIRKKILYIENYGEIGCPIWGMINIAKENNCSTYFIKPHSDLFWGSNCKKGKYKCLEKISETKIISRIDKLSEKQLDFVGVFNLIDHYHDPVNFIQNILKYSRSIGIITEKIKSGIPIQHHNSLSDKSVQKISLILNKKVDFGYNKIINKSGYNFYLIY